MVRKRGKFLASGVSGIETEHLQGKDQAWHNPSTKGHCPVADFHTKYKKREEAANSSKKSLKCIQQ